jgi:hypothetical protein
MVGMGRTISDKSLLTMVKEEVYTKFYTCIHIFNLVSGELSIWEMPMRY